MTETVHNASMRMITLLAAFFLLLLGLVMGWQVFVSNLPQSVAVGGLDLSLDLGSVATGVRLAWGGLSLACLVLSFFLFMITFAQPRRKGKQIVLSGNSNNGIYGGGRVTVSLGSLHAVLIRAAERIEGVREASPKLTLKKAGWHVDCLVAIRPDAAMPEVTAALKTRLKDTLEHHTGLPVERIDIAAQLNPVRDLQRVR